MDINAKLQQICQGFRIEGEFIGFSHIKVGNVNQTYQVRFRREDGAEKDYIVQEVNTYAFRRPKEVMHNIDLVTEHIRAKKPGQVALHFHHTEDRLTYIFDKDGFWRLCNYIPSNTFNVCSDNSVLRGTAEAFGEFQQLLSDFDATQLYETIYHFHDTPHRLADLFQSAHTDPIGRADEIQPDLEYIHSIAERACTLSYLRQDGKLPIRVTHNDTKINNVLFDPNTHQPVAVIDLDTVMPGLIAHDFGDAIRSAANPAGEDCTDLSKVDCDLDVFRTFTMGFLSKTASVLTHHELQTLALSPFVLAVELGSRFLDDYLQGDHYFHIDYPTHNLVRGRCQLELSKRIWEKMPQMESIVTECYQQVTQHPKASASPLKFTI